MNAIRITTATGEQLTVEAGSSRCFHSEEVSESPEFYVPEGTLCDICEEEIET